MTTVLVFDSDYSPEGVARRLREELARRNLSESAAARHYGVPQQWVNRRMTGLTSWKVSELAHFCRVLELSYTYIVAGGRPLPEPPDGTAAPTPATVTPLRQQLNNTADTDAAGIDDAASAYIQLAEPKPSTLRLTAECSA
ncbi:hypothetical protein PJJ30_23915, partial [Mycobacterium kansasii]